MSGPKKDRNTDRPTAEQLRRELHRETHKRRYGATLRSTIYALLTVAAAAVLVATLWLPVLQIYGTSMAPTLKDGEIVVSLKSSRFAPGEIVAFYYNNKILIKRCIASAGDWVDIEEDGSVYVNGELLDEPYIEELSYGICDIEFPYQVPESKIFVLGDNRATSIDSRSSAIGCISEEQIVGRITFRVWPMEGFGTV